jgi:hypothetical protein
MSDHDFVALPDEETGGVLRNIQGDLRFKPVSSDPIANGEFSDDEDEGGILEGGHQSSQKSSKKRMSAEEEAKSKKALCWSILAMAMSLPALIGA